ncbi:MAG: DUF3943 domain-containing protein [Alphaproteobacteria bacterium]|nr:DUF3943 domain-containing protein [Alphaproteobacteria bacterium]
MLKKSFQIISFLTILLFSITGTAQNIKTDTPSNEIPIKLSIYDRPYSIEENIVDKEMLKRNTISLFGVGIGTMAFLYAMPTSFTNWEDDGKSPAKKWWDNVSRAPVWDKDDLFLNYVTHPYAGAIYYMGARSAGANAAYSCLYSFALSTFFWEYGIEAFAERPSIQDLIVTPLAGAVVGEWFYKSKRQIIKNNYTLYDSKFLGRTALILMDPMTEISNYIWKDEKPMNNSFSLTSQPFVTPHGRLGYGISLKFSF